MVMALLLRWIEEEIVGLELGSGSDRLYNWHLYKCSCFGVIGCNACSRAKLRAYSRYSLLFHHRAGGTPIKTSIIHWTRLDPDGTDFEFVPGSTILYDRQPAGLRFNFRPWPVAFRANSLAQTFRQLLGLLSVRQMVKSPLCIAII